MVILIFIFILLLLFIAASFVFNLLLNEPFKYKKYSKYVNLTHDNFTDIQPCIIKSGRHKLNGYIYGKDNTKGTIVFSHGMGVNSDYYIKPALYFVEKGYKVLLFDDTGYWKNKGLFLGVPQAVKDLNCAINYIDDKKTPITLIGHSMGGYSVCAVLNSINSYTVSIKNVISFSGFASYPETVGYVIKSNIKHMSGFVTFCIKFFETLIFGKLKNNMAVKGLNQSKVRALIIQGSKDAEIPADCISIYSKKNEITNPEVDFILCTNQDFNTHMGVVKNKDNLNQEIFETIYNFIDGGEYENSL